MPSKKNIIIECGAPVSLTIHRGNADSIDGLGEYSRVIIHDLETGEEIEIFRGEKFSEECYQEKIRSRDHIYTREGRLPPD